MFPVFIYLTLMCNLFIAFLFIDLISDTLGLFIYHHNSAFCSDNKTHSIYHLS